MKEKRKRIYRLVAACLALLVAFTGLLTVQAAGVAKPTKLSAKVNDNVSVTLQWTAAKKVSGYQVYTAGSKSGKYTLLANQVHPRQFERRQDLLLQGARL